MLLPASSSLLPLLLLGGVVALADVCPVDRQHPVVLVPGLCGSVLEGLLDIPADVQLPNKECARKTDEWEVLWISAGQMLPRKFDCLIEYYLSLDFNASSGFAQPKRGVSVRVPDFGGVYAIDHLDPEDPVSVLAGNFHKAIETLRALGFDEGRTLFAAPFDWRRFPSQQWLADTRNLIETAYQRSGGRRVVLAAHSMGGPASYLLLMSQSAAWREKYIERWIPSSAVWGGSPTAAFAMLGKALVGLPSYFGEIGAGARHFESMFFLLPNAAFGPQPVVTTPSHSYDWANVSDVLERAGISWASAATKAGRSFVGPFGFAHPGVNTTSVWSSGVETITSMHYSLDAEVGITAPVPKFGDGDGLVPVASLSHAYEIWAADPSTAPLTSKVFVTSKHVNHLSIISSSEYISLLCQASCPAI